MPLTGPQVRAIAGRMLDRAQLMNQEAISARGVGAKRAAFLLEALAGGIRQDALELARGFPAANDQGGGPPPAGGGPPAGEDPPFGPDEPTPPPPKAA